MAYRTNYSTIIAALLTALRATAVANALGVNTTAWASTTSPRVMVGQKDGYVAGLHRGRLPAVEVWPIDEDWTRESANGGTVITQWGIRVHHNGPTPALAEEACRLGLYSCFAQVRGDASSNGLSIGAKEHVPALVQTPLGFALESEIAFAHSFGVSDFTVKNP